MTRLRGPARRAHLTSLALGLLVLVLPPASAAAPTWLAPVDLSAGGENADPDIGVDAAGNATAVWSRVIARPLGPDTIVQVSHHPAGGAWSAPQGLSSAGGDKTSADGRSPQVAVNAAGDAVAVWEWRDSAAPTPVWLVQASVRPAATGVWSEPVTLSQDGGDANNSQVAIDQAGNAAAVWERWNGSTNVIHATSRPASSGVWSAVRDLSKPNELARNPHVAQMANAALFGGDDVGFAVWERWNGASWSVAAARAWQANGGWVPNESNLTQSGSSPQVALDAAGHAIVVWRFVDVVESRVNDPPTGWSDTIRLSAAGENAIGDPQIALDPFGNGVAVWARTDGASAFVQAAVRSGTSGVWSPPEYLAMPGGSALEPQVALNPAGNAVAVWKRHDGANWIVQAAALPAVSITAGGWAAPQDLSASGQDAEVPRVALDAAGNGVAVWRRYDGTNWVVQAAGYDAAGPMFGDLATPASGTAGMPLSFSVSVFDVWSELAPGPVWTFGDGTSAAGTSVSHTYDAPGTYTVNVSHADTLGNLTSTSREVSIEAAPPSPAAEAPPPPAPEAPPSPPVSAPPPPSPQSSPAPSRQRAEPNCVVPKIVGKRLAKAKAAIKKRHCRIGKVRRKYSRNRAEGHVLSQRPRGGKRLANGARVAFVVSRGREPASLKSHG